MKKLYFLFLLLITGTISWGQVVISQVYTGGGNSSAIYLNDFVELFNQGSTPVSLNGYSLQATSGSTWNVALLSGTIQPNSYFLIQQGSGGAVGSALPSPDLIPSNLINLVTNNAKVALVNNTTALTTDCPLPSAIILDFVGYGPSANCYEGAGPTATISANNRAMRRINAGCTDTNNNSNDFVVYTISNTVARNSSSPTNDCSVLSIGKNEIANFALYPNPVKGGKVFISSANNNAERSIQIFDVLGKQVVSQKGSQNNVEVSHLTKGVYIIKVTEEGKTATRKLVVE